MAKGSCSKCKIILTKDNCPLSILERKSGYCCLCKAKYRVDNLERVTTLQKAWYDKNKSSLYKRYSDYRGTLRARHANLLVRLRKERVPKTDLLWSFNYYSEFIKDGLCHYCRGPLSPKGHNLDRMNNELRHVCYNVVLCCHDCNRIKGPYWEYEHMMMLAPKLRKLKNFIR